MPKKDGTMKNSGQSIETALKNTTGNLEYDLDLLQKIMAVQILDALKNSTELAEAAANLSELQERREKIRFQLAECMRIKAYLNLPGNSFGILVNNTNPLKTFEDIFKKKEYETNMKVITDAIAMFEKILDSYSTLSEAIRKNQLAVTSAVTGVVGGLKTQMQQDVDDTFSNLI
jgi:hypothetical protein